MAICDKETATKTAKKLYGEDAEVFTRTYVMEQAKVAVPMYYVIVGDVIRTVGGSWDALFHPPA